MSDQMETVTIYKDSYFAEMDRAFELRMQLATLQGSIRALSEMDDSPEFVFKQLKELVKNFDKEVD